MFFNLDSENELQTSEINGTKHDNLHDSATTNEMQDIPATGDLGLTQKIQNVLENPTIPTGDPELTRKIQYILENPGEFPNTFLDPSTSF